MKTHPPSPGACLAPLLVRNIITATAELRTRHYRMLLSHVNGFGSPPDPDVVFFLAMRASGAPGPWTEALADAIWPPNLLFGGAMPD